jgi:hypothetical protein
MWYKGFSIRAPSRQCQSTYYAPPPRGPSYPSFPHFRLPQNAPNSFPCHTSEKPTRKPFSCHTSKSALPQVLCLPHIRPPLPGRAVGDLVLAERLFGFSPAANSELVSSASCRERQTANGKRVTAHHPLVPLRWPSRSARIGIVRGKYWETKPLLSVSKKESGQRVRQG